MRQAESFGARGDAGGAHGRRRSGSIAALGIATAVLLLLDILPAWLLSVTAIYGQAGDTSVYAMAGFALAWFVVAIVTVPLATWFGPGRVALGCAVLTATARIVLQTDASSTLQVYASSVALLGLLCWLIATAVRGVGGQVVAVGVAAGFASGATLQVALGGVAPLWQAAAVGWPITIVLVVVFVAGAAIGTPARVTGDTSPASGRMWFAVGPALLIAAVVTAAPMRSTLGVTAVSRWPQLLVALGALAGVRLAVGGWAVRRSGAFVSVALVVLVGAAVLPRATVDGVHGVLSSWAVVPQTLAAACLGAVLGRLAPANESNRIRRGLAAWAGLLVFFLACFLYYAVYVVDLGFSNLVLLLVVSVVLGALALRVGSPERQVQIGRRATPVTVVAAAAVVLLGLPGVLQEGPAPPAAGSGFPIRLVSYNIHVGGVSNDGRYDPAAIARVISSQHPDVVWLSEVDRGWLVDGQHDALPRMAHDLGMHLIYAPAADPDWGDAVLSRLPMHVYKQRKLPRAGAPTGAEAMAVVVDLGRGQHLGLVGTHLQTLDDNVTVPVAQARSVAELGHDMTADGYPVVITGDLNVPPGSPTLAPLNARFQNGLAPWRPLKTWPSDHPDEQLDHVYVTSTLRLTDAIVPATTAADHRPVAVTLDLR